MNNVDINFIKTDYTAYDSWKNWKKLISKYEKDRIIHWSNIFKAIKIKNFIDNTSFTYLYIFNDDVVYIGENIGIRNPNHRYFALIKMFYTGRSREISHSGAQRLYEKPKDKIQDDSKMGFLVIKVKDKSFSILLKSSLLVSYKGIFGKFLIGNKDYNKEE
jgi:hypothetical protein